MNREIVQGCLISLPITIAAYAAFRRANCSVYVALVVATLFFPCPLFVANAGSASYVYLYDVAFLSAIFWWILEGGRIRLGRWGAPAVLLFLGVGLVPFIFSILASPVFYVTKFYAINLFRAFGGVSVYCMIISTDIRTPRDSLVGVSVMCIILAVAMYLQGLGYLSANVFYSLLEVESTEVIKYAIAGLFRGSLGIVGCIGLLVYLIGEGNQRSYVRILYLVGAVSGLGIIIMSGSRTSFVAACITLIIAVVFGIVSRGRAVLAVTALALICLPLLMFFSNGDFEYAYKDRIFQIFDADSGVTQLETSRGEQWGMAREIVTRDPLKILGLSRVSYGVLVMPDFHNEYLGVLIAGSVWSFLFYASGLVLLVRNAFYCIKLNTPCGAFSFLCVCAGVLHAATVGHLVPGLYFGGTSGLFWLCYGIGTKRAIVSATDRKFIK